VVEVTQGNMMSGSSTRVVRSLLAACDSLQALQNHACQHNLQEGLFWDAAA
jgi:hypothetical protein